MEQYREKLKMQNALMTIGCGILSMFCSMISRDGNLFALPKPAVSENWQDFWQGFCTGAAMGILLRLVFFLARNLRAMHDDNLLKNCTSKATMSGVKKFTPPPVELLCRFFSLAAWLGCASAAISA